MTRIGTVYIDTKSVLAPLAGITDLSFRLLAREMGAGAVFTEMISADGLVRGNNKTHRYMFFEEAERPIGFQIFGSDPAIMAEAAKIVADRKPDFIDINFGCPVKKVIKRNAGAALLRDPKLLGEIMHAVVQAVSLPVLAKIRSGWSRNMINAVSVAKIIEDTGAAAVTVHPRTQEMGFSGRADWGIIRQVKEAVGIPVIGNGDLTSASDAKRMLNETGCDLVMVGRAAFGNPWIFRQIATFLSTSEVAPLPSVRERIGLCVRHMRMLIKEKGELVGVRQMRKHIAAYTKGMGESSMLRREIFRIERAEEVEAALWSFAERIEVMSDRPRKSGEPALAQW